MNVIVCDRANNRVQIFDPQGNFKLMIGKKQKGSQEDGFFNSPFGVAVTDLGDHPPFFSCLKVILVNVVVPVSLLPHGFVSSLPFFAEQLVFSLCNWLQFFWPCSRNLTPQTIYSVFDK
jgi:hypothetical protein